MIIDVIHKGYDEGKVEDYLLDSLIESNKILAFRRRSGWVVIGRDPVRVRHILYSDNERRKVIHGQDFSMK